MTIGCNIWMICLILNWFFYGLSRMFQLPQFVWAQRSSVWDVFINFLLIDATDRSKISSDQKRFFIALSLYPLSFFANTPFNPKEFVHITATQFNYFTSPVCPFKWHTSNSLHIMIYRLKYIYWSIIIF